MTFERVGNCINGKITHIVSKHDHIYDTLPVSFSVILIVM